MKCQVQKQIFSFLLFCRVISLVIIIIIQIIPDIISIRIISSTN